MSLVLVVIVFIIAVFAVNIIIRQMKFSGTASPSGQAGAQASGTPHAAEKKGPDADVRQILNTLIKLNILIRTDRALPMALTVKTEAVIDNLKTLVPDMITRHPGETLTYELKKIGSVHLFKTVKEYLDLSENSRETQQQTFEKTIESLHEVCTRSREIVDNNEITEFKTMAHFLAGKFS